MVSAKSRGVHCARGAGAHATLKCPFLCMWAYCGDINKLITVYLARSANLPTGLYILPSVISRTQLNYLKIRWTDFHNLYIKWKLFGRRWSNWTSFFEISRDVAMATDFVQKLPTAPALIALSLRNGMGYRLANECINSSTNCSTWCKNGENRFSSFWVKPG